MHAEYCANSPIVAEQIEQWEPLDNLIQALRSGYGA
jgi:hypothetical protein